MNEDDERRVALLFVLALAGKHIDHLARASPVSDPARRALLAIGRRIPRPAGSRGSRLVPA